MVSNRDVARVRSATNSKAMGLFAAQFAVAMVWGGEVIKRLTPARGELHSTVLRRGDGEPHRALEAQLAAEKATRAAENEARTTEKRVMQADLDALLVKKTSVKVELEETKARSEEEIGRMKSEAANAWDLGKEEFLKSSEFEDLCAKKSLAYFKTGFASCVAQFRANGYSEEEHPAPFLSVARALEELPEEDEEAEDDADEGALGDDATPPSSPKQ
ncbi:hypothetical protein F511_23386 [Dorcoceras hygrometricum]|uniref:Uncharacterized protein n=1 Tax=Dorcoceras hygrometricum TaxID=472368 RepID=A0A2Z7AHL5_9LAMI|nr:hypothetical protein F511_23386 [Dorcoceras hygrometricum]